MGSPKLELLPQCRDAVALARRQGADGAEAFVQSVETVNSTVEKNDLQISKSQFETSIGVRAFVGHRVGFASTNALQSLKEACRDAVALARISPEDPHNVLPETDEPRLVEGLFDPRAERFCAADAVRRTADMLDLAESIDRRVILNDAWFDASIRHVAMANSLGLAAEERGSLFTYGAVATAREGDRVSNFDFQFDATRKVDRIDVAPPIRRVCERALASLGAEKGRSFKGTVLLSPTAVSEILVGTLLFQLNARNGLRGRSRWWESVGKAVCAAGITLVDDGRLRGGVATASFDREGVEHREVVLIRDGVLSSLFHNAYSAHASGLANTAHASGSSRTIPGIGPTNLTLRAGEATMDELISEVERGLLVRRFSGNADPISGDFSGAVKAAQLIEEGKLTRAVSGTLIAGNLFDALRRVSGVSRDTERVFNLTLPYVRLERVSVTAN
jgi:PmbA protein